MWLIQTLAFIFAVCARADSTKDVKDDAYISALVKRLFSNDSTSHRDLLAARAGADFNGDLTVTRHSPFVTPVPKDPNSYRDLLAARAGADFDDDLAVTRHPSFVTPIPKGRNAYRDLLAARAGADFDDDLAVTKISSFVTPIPKGRGAYRDLLAARAGADYDKELAVARHSSFVTPIPKGSKQKRNWTSAQFNDTEMVNITDLTPAHKPGFPTRLAFLVNRGAQNMSLNLTKIRQSPKIKKLYGKNVKLYRDSHQGGHYLVNLTRSKNGHYLRTLETFLDRNFNLTGVYNMSARNGRIFNSTGVFNISGATVHLKPFPLNDSVVNRMIKLSGKLVSVPHIMQTTNDRRTKKRNVKVKHSVQRNSLLQIFKREHVTDFPPPTVNLPTVNIPTSGEPETTPVSPSTTEVYPTSTPAQCTDDYEQCSTWLKQGYNNDYRTFCERDGYDWWCCETCLDWDSGSGSGECKDTGYNSVTCEDLLRWGVDNDKQELCDIFGTECCNTCSEDSEEDDEDDNEQPDNCKDEGYGGCTCDDLLDYGTNGDLDELCTYFSEECCEMCSRK